MPTGTREKRKGKDAWSDLYRPALEEKSRPEKGGQKQTNISGMDFSTAEAAADYCRRDFAVVPIPPGKKGPVSKGWNQPGGYFTDPEDARQYWRNHPKDNLGAVLAPSGLCSLDVDDVDGARLALAELGIDLDRFPATYPTVQGAPPRFRCLFKVPALAAELTAHKLIWPPRNGEKEGVTVFELRAGPVQDVLPPSIHPDTGKPYTWLNPLPDGDLADLPAELLDLWLNWSEHADSLKDLCPWAPKKPPPPPPQRPPPSHDVIDAFNAAHSLAAILEQHGYQRKGNRYLAPSSSSKIPGVTLFQDETFCVSHHASDTLSDGKAHDAFDVYRLLEHGGDVSAAVKAAARGLGIPPPALPASAKGKGKAKAAATARDENHPAPDPIEKPNATAIYCRAGETPWTADEAENVLIKAGGIFQRAGGLVRPAHKPAETVRGIARPNGALVLLPVDAALLQDDLDRRVYWYKWDSRTQKWVTTNCPAKVANTLIARRGLWRFPSLIGVTTAPTLRPDGSILSTPGYDRATGLLYQPAAEFPTIPEQPSKDTATAALNDLKTVLKDFSFAQPMHQSVALAAILTAVTRRILPTAPMFGFTAPKRGSGKSLLADVVSLIATGQTATVVNHSTDPEETRKRIVAVLLEGDAVINIDNVEAPLKGDTLCSVLTQESFTDRLLSTNKTVTVPTTATWVATGNNLEIAGDLTRRFLPCALDPLCERPEERPFDRNLYEWIPENRPRLVAAALTVLRAYVVAGKPNTGLSVYGSFEQWSNLIRGALVWLAEPDPLKAREEVEDSDPVRATLKALLSAWHPIFKDLPTTTADVVAAANRTLQDESGAIVPEYPELNEAVATIAANRDGKLSAQRLGDYLRRHLNRVEAGARFVAADDYGTRKRWKVEIKNEVRR